MRIAFRYQAAILWVGVEVIRLNWSSNAIFSGCYCVIIAILLNIGIAKVVFV